MFSIEQDQVNQLSDIQAENFVRDMCVHVSRRFPDEIPPPESVEPLVRKRLEDADDYGLSSRYDLRRYLEFTFEAGGDLDDEELSWAKDILKEPELHPMEKMDRIDQAMTFDYRRA